MGPYPPVGRVRFQSKAEIPSLQKQTFRSVRLQAHAVLQIVVRWHACPQELHQTHL